jgi:hypothetical protein
MNNFIPILFNFMELNPSREAAGCAATESQSYFTTDGRSVSMS